MTELETLKLDAQELRDENYLRELEIRNVQSAILIAIALAKMGVDVSDHIEMLRKRIELLKENAHALGKHEAFRGKYSLT